MYFFNDLRETGVIFLVLYCNYNQSATQAKSLTIHRSSNRYSSAILLILLHLSGWGPHVEQVMNALRFDVAMQWTEPVLKWSSPLPMLTTNIKHPISHAHLLQVSIALRTVERCNYSAFNRV